MAVHIKTKINVRVWEEVEEDNILFAPDDNLVEDVIDNMQHIVSGRLTIADAATASIPMDDITTVMGLMFRSDQDVDISINGGAAIHLHRPSAGTPDNPTYCKLYLDCTIASLAITKPTTVPPVAANVRYCVFGDKEV